MLIAQKGEDSDEEATTNNINMVQWRGNVVPEKEAKALKHVFDDLQDFFCRGNQPNLTIRFSTALAYSGQGRLWLGDLDCTYNIDGENCNLAYFGMDVCIDLCPKLLHKYGEAMLKDYGTSWIYVYLPQPTFEKVIEYVKAGTGWDVSTEAVGIVYDHNRDLVAIEAKLHHESGEPQPSFWVVKDDDEHASGGGEGMSFSRIGSVQEVNAIPNQQRVHRGIGIFSVSMEVEGTPNFNPTPNTGEEANLTFTLVSCRTWGITDCVAPIVYAPDKSF